MTNNLSLTFILTLLLLVIWLAGCGESETIVPAPTGHVLEGTFVLVKAVGHQLMDVGGEHINNPLIIRFVPHTYYYPQGTGRLILRPDGSFLMEAPMSLQPIHIDGTFEFIPEGTDPKYEPERLEMTWTNLNPDSYPSQGRGTCCPEFPFTWMGDTLKLEFDVTQNIDWELFWKRMPDM